MQDLHHGKEIYIFFGKYQIFGILGISISSIFFCILTYKLLKIIKEKNIDNYNEFLLFIFENKKFKEKIYHIIKVTINIFLLISYYIMLAGLSSYFREKYDINSYITAIISSFLCYIVLNKNIEGVIKISIVCVPIIIVFIIGMGLKNFELGVGKVNNMCFESNSIYLSIISALLYVGYNSILLIPVVITLRKYCKKNNIKIISFFIFFIVWVLGLCVYFILLRGNYFVMQMDMPIAYIIRVYEKKYSFLYGCVIIISIFTSIISDGYSLLSNCSSNKVKYQKYLKLICISSIFISNIGFSKLINLLYPLFGLFGIIQIYFIFKRKIE